jgi:hypothetical protein
MLTYEFFSIPLENAGLLIIDVDTDDGEENSSSQLGVNLNLIENRRNGNIVTELSSVCAPVSDFIWYETMCDQITDDLWILICELVLAPSWYIT